MTSGGGPVVVLDRDGTLNVEVHYLSHPDQVELLPGVVEGLQALRAAGCRLVVVTNQSAIGRGYFDEACLQTIHDRLQALLGEHGVTLDAIYHCPHIPEDGCQCRKPGTLLVEQAAAALDFDPTHVFVVGDKPCDIDLGRGLGATTLLVRTGYGSAHERSGDTSADFVVDDLRDASRVIIGRLRADRTGEMTQNRQHIRARRHLEASIEVTRQTVDECLPSIV
ncbi:MAG: HAD family hydrolase, partial [Acidimicrobiales bacterium]